MLGGIGAHEWRRRGVVPTRPGCVELVAEAELPDRVLAFDLGTGTGVPTALLRGRGVRRVLATDLEPRAVRCARHNLRRLGRVRVDRPTGSRPEGRMLGGFLRGLPAHLREGGEGWLVLSDLAELLGLRPRGELPARFAAAGLEVLGRTEIPTRHPRAGERTGDPLDAARAAERITLWRLAPARKPVPRSGRGHEYG